jgi:hypothetical protein
MAAQIDVLPGSLPRLRLARRARSPMAVHRNPNDFGGVEEPRGHHSHRPVSLGRVIIGQIC